MATNFYNVFVYGTLKKGEPNDHVFKKAANGYFKFICKAQTTEKYPLIIATDYNVPFLLYKPGVGNTINGEIYTVDENVLQDLDELEDHPNFYMREEHNFSNVDDKEKRPIKAWIYFIKYFNDDLLRLPMYSTYHSKGGHGKEYIARERTTIQDLNGILPH